MSDPAISWSSPGLKPRYHGPDRYALYSTPLEKMRNRVGTTGAKDCPKRYRIPSGLDSRGSSGIRLMSGIHRARAEPNSTRWTRKWNGSLSVVRLVTAGQWVTNRTSELNTRAGTGRQ